jgi:general stress protein 26
MDDHKKLAELISEFRFVMLTTAAADGSLHSRPMTMQDRDFDGDLWFFTSADAPKVWEANRGHQVNVSFSDPHKNTYISVSGTANLVRDRKKIEELWKPPYKLFFPKGLEDPELALLKVTVEKAEYWDSPSSFLGRTFTFAKAWATGKISALGDHGKVEL